MLASGSFLNDPGSDPRRSVQILALRFWVSLCIFSLAIVTPVLTRADDNTATNLTIELNTVQQDQNRCRLVFVASNSTGKTIDELSLETVLFNASGSFLRLTLFDFKSLPAGKPRVRQFAIPDTQCADLGRILINGTAQCVVGGAASKLCDDTLNLKSKTKQDLVG